MNNNHAESNPRSDKPKSEAERQAALADWRASVERDHTAMLYIKQSLFLNQINALTDGDFEELIEHSKGLAQCALTKDTTPTPDSLARFGKQVTEGQLAYQRIVRNIINVAGKLRKIRAKSRSGF